MDKDYNHMSTRTMIHGIEYAVAVRCFQNTSMELTDAIQQELRGRTKAIEAHAHCCYQLIGCVW